MKKISVIMGVYNCAETLPEAIESILAQTYPNWELILCDDGSNDESFAIADTYRAKFPEKIILLQHSQNLGLNQTLNDCLTVATGDYAARMDGDDISMPERFEKEIAVLDAENDIAVVSCPMIYFDEKGIWGIGRRGEEYPRKEMLIHGTVHCHAPCMMRIEVLRKVGGYSVDKHLLRVEDWHLWLKMYTSGHQGKNLSEPLYQMRDDRNATNRRKFKYRLNEAYVSRLAVKELHLGKWRYVYSLRPILVGLLPKPLYLFLHQKKIKKS